MRQNNQQTTQGNNQGTTQGTNQGTTQGDNQGTAQGPTGLPPFAPLRTRIPVGMRLYLGVLSIFLLFAFTLRRSRVMLTSTVRSSTITSWGHT